MTKAGAGSKGVAPPSRWRPRVSLRALMVLVLLIGGLLGWRVRRASIQRRAVAAIRAAGGSVFYDYQVPVGKPWQIGAAPGTPRWLREWVGDEYFQDVVVVMIAQPKGQPSKATPATLDAILDCDRLQFLQTIRVAWDEPRLARLASLSNLDDLTILDGGLTDSGIQHFRELTSLTRLMFRVKPGELTGTSLKAFAGMMDRLKKLEILGLDPIEPADLTPIRGLKQLDYLRLVLSPEAGECLESVRGLDNLKILDFRQTRARDADLTVLTTLPRLEHFLIDAAEITDAGMATLGKIRTLDTLYLFHDTAEPAGRITDAGLAELASLKKLRSCWVDNRYLTAAGWAKLSALPIVNLNLSGLQSHQKDLVAVATRRPLQTLGLNGPGVTDDWLDLLAGQTSLQQLDLNNTAITDAGIDKIFLHTPTVSYLSLDSTGLTDAGLLKFATATGAAPSISALGTKVTEAGVAAVRAARAGIHVEIGPVVPYPGHRAAPQPSIRKGKE